MLAHQDIIGMWRESFIPDDDLNELRILLKRREHLAKERTRIGNRIRSTLLRFGHTVNAYGAVGKTYANSVIEDLVRGEIPDTSGVCPDGLPDGARRIIEEYFDRWNEVSKMIISSTKDVKEKVYSMSFRFGDEMIEGNKAVEKLKTVPGVGNLSAYYWLSEIYDVRRFESDKKCVAYCGFDPTLKVSAGKVTAHKRRGGNKKLHNTISNAAGTLISKKTEPFGRWGHRLYKRNAKGGYKKACNAVGRRMIVGLFHVQRLNQDFSYDKYNFWKEKEVKKVGIEEMNLGRFKPILLRLGLDDSQKITKAYYTDLASEKGVGVKCLEKIRQWISENSKEESSSKASSWVERKRNLKRRLASIIRSSREKQ